MFFQNFCYSHFFGQIWSQNLKFAKLTEIWYRGTLLYAYYDFDVYFSKICVTHVFLIKFGSIIWISSNWSKFRRGLHFYMLNTVLMFIFSRFFSFIFFGQIWSQNQKFFKLTKIWYRGRSLYAYFDFNVYFFKIFVIHIFWANLVPKPEVLQIN